MPSPSKPGSTTKADLVKHVARDLGLSLRRSTRGVEAILGSLRDALLEGNDVDLSPFGIFELRKQGARIGRNPRTGERVSVEGRWIPSFIAGRDLHAP